MQHAWVYENNFGGWSLVSEEMNAALEKNDTWEEKGINRTITLPAYIITSSLSNGMSGIRFFVQRNRFTGKTRVLKRVSFYSPYELQRILKDGSDIEITRAWVDSTASPY